MPIENNINLDEVPEEFLLNIVPINDPEYGGDKPTALRNARRMYMFATNPQKYLEKAPEFIGEKPTDFSSPFFPFKQFKPFPGFVELEPFRPFTEFVLFKPFKTFSWSKKDPINLFFE